MLIFFISHQEIDKPVKVLTGDVLMFRNPCLHPGDLRLVRAVDLPELSGIIKPGFFTIDTLEKFISSQIRLQLWQWFCLTFCVHFQIKTISGYTNIVLLPATKHCSTSLADECSGGDLVIFMTLFFNVLKFFGFVQIGRESWYWKSSIYITFLWNSSDIIFDILTISAETDIYN